MTSVFLVDDHEMVRRGVAAVIQATPDLDVVGEAGGYREATRRIAATLPDVVVLDVHLPDGSGIDLCRAIRQKHPGMRCLILTAYDDDDAVIAAVMAGADGHLLKTVRAADLPEAVRAVAAGRRLLDPATVRRATGQVASGSADSADPRFASLTMRERQILALIADALTNRQIADRLGLAEKTVKNYVTSMLGKLGFTHRTQAAVFELSRMHDEG
ncbi:response regulator [Microbacterium sp. AGC62]|uniref:response regulator n=1 Tax=Microbacterium TaxID=33882 RepID=UPI00049359AC|nr:MULTISPECIES: response regulator transcription factor [unclassified Microbacterium]PRB63833.1 DNA-binding response regulator [Microbacterium sp. MYb45]